MCTGRYLMLFLKKILLGFEDETWLYMQLYITKTYMKRGEQQKIFHKGTNDKINASITLLYPQNKIKFNMGKTSNSGNDFITSKKHQKVCAKKEYQKIHPYDRQRIISCQQKDDWICGDTG